LEHHHRAAAGAIELEHHRGRFELRIDLLRDAQEFVRIVGFHHAQEATQALVVDVGKRGHGVSRPGMSRSTKQSTGHPMRWAAGHCGSIFASLASSSHFLISLGMKSASALALPGNGAALVVAMYCRVASILLISANHASSLVTIGSGAPAG